MLYADGNPSLFRDFGEKKSPLEVYFMTYETHPARSQWHIEASLELPLPIRTVEVRAD